MSCIYANNSHITLHILDKHSTIGFIFLFVKKILVSLILSLFNAVEVLSTFSVCCFVFSNQRQFLNSILYQFVLNLDWKIV